jgi:CheY-like chemotaxis protein
MSETSIIDRIAIIDDSPATLECACCDPQEVGPSVLGAEAFKSGAAFTADEWFNTIVLKWLREIVPVPQLLLVNANLKFCPDSLRTDWHGLTVAAHIRYDRTLAEPIRFSHIILYSFAPHLLDAAAVPERLIAYSPGVTFTRAPIFRLSTKGLKILSARRITVDDARSGILAMETTGGENPEAYVHSVRNRLGVSKFLREFAPDVIRSDHPLCAASEQATTLEQKRVLFLHPELAAKYPLAEKARTELRRAATDRVFLHIDDEYDRGWCLGLNAGLSGDSPRANGGSVRPIATLGDALETLQRARALWEGALGRWEWAMTALKDAPSRIERAKKRDCTDAEKLSAAEEEAASAERKWVLAESTRAESLKRLMALWPTFNDLALEVLDASTSARFGSRELGAEIVPKLGALRGLSAAHQDFERADAEYKHCELTAIAALDKLREVKDSRRESAEGLRSVEEASVLAARSIEEARRDLEAASPWSAVFLDLRLEMADEGRSPNDLSGWKVFDELQRYFPHIPICILTASQRAANAGRAYQLGATAYWIKGVSSGRDMLIAVSECLKRGQLAPLWRKICLVSRLPVVVCRRYDGRDWLNVPRDQADPARMLIQKLIEECFWTFWRHCVANRPSRLQANPWESVVLNLGVIQEMRFSIDTRRIPPGTISDALGRELGPTELELRRLRNWLAHRRGPPPPDWQDQAERMARAMFEHILEALIKT